jgi:ribosomal protein S18 acetylase RimI-like enzyme
MSADQAARAATALADVWRWLLKLHPEAWSDTRGGVFAFASGIPLAGLNGVSCSTLDPDPADIRHMLGELRDRGVPHLLQMRPGCDPAALAVGDEEGLARDEDVPLMRLDNPAALDAAQASIRELDLRLLEPDEATVHHHTVAAGFEAEAEHFARLLPPSVMEAEGMRAYVGEVGGEPVTTAIGARRDDYVAIFNVATPPEHGRRGYGAAVTARAVSDGLADGASWAWLQSSPSGYRVYEALGFRTLETWPAWVLV